MRNNFSLAEFELLKAARDFKIGDVIKFIVGDKDRITPAFVYKGHTDTTLFYSFIDKAYSKRDDSDEFRYMHGIKDIEVIERSKL